MDEIFRIVKTDDGIWLVPAESSEPFDGFEVKLEMDSAEIARRTSRMIAAFLAEADLSGLFF